MHSKYSICFIINPISGTTQKHHLPELFEKEIDTSQFEWEIKYTDRPKHATELAKQSVQEGFDTIVAVGGDGTINEVGRALVGTNSRLGIIPLGSGNGLARHLGIPLSVKGALNTILKGANFQMDSCQVNGQAFFCTSGVGFDATVSHYFAKDRDNRGLWNYAKTSIKQYFRYEPKTYQIEIDGTQYSEKAFIIAVANAAQYGNNAHISPEADVSDGLMDVCIMKSFPKALGLWLIFQSFNKSIHLSRYVTILRGKHVRIQNANEFAHLDGDPVSLNPKLEYKILEKSLNVCVPKSR